ncbi:MAG: hypothetical protein KGH58_00335 [Candidatus Micrarchaeota archaeon]|nr:hypothetical protein [Candidatus Micrarchaeota archaeon]
MAPEKMSDLDSWFSAHQKRVAKSQSEADLSSTVKLLLRTMDIDAAKKQIKTLVADMLNARVNTVDHMEGGNGGGVEKTWNYLFNSWANQGRMEGSNAPLEGRLWFAGKDEISISREAVLGIKSGGFDGAKAAAGIDECSARYGLFRIALYNSVNPEGGLKEFNIHMWLSRRVVDKSFDVAARKLGNMFGCNAVTLGPDEPTITWRMPAR